MTVEGQLTNIIGEYDSYRLCTGWGSGNFGFDSRELESLAVKYRIRKKQLQLKMCSNMRSDKVKLNSWKVCINPIPHGVRVKHFVFFLHNK